VKFTVHMEPVPKDRPRTTVKNGKARIYTPSNTTKAEWQIRQAFILVAGSGAAIRRPTPIFISATFYLPRPKSLPKRITKPIARPDLDNLFKAVKDALRGYAWDDDSQVTSAVPKKRFGSPPRIEIDIQVDTEE